MTKSSKAAVPTCAIDRDIVNEFTLAKMKDIGQSFFASACGKNRGACVLDKPDGMTYSCLLYTYNAADALLCVVSRCL